MGVCSRLGAECKCKQLKEMFWPFKPYFWRNMVDSVRGWGVRGWGLP